MSIVKYLIPLAVLGAGCGRSPSLPLVCAEAGTAQGVNLTILDSISGTQFPFYELSAIATDGTYRDSLSIPVITSAPSHVYWLASDREGTYAVTVRARGYQLWTKNRVVVGRADCKIVPANLTVRLQRAI